jgi:anti-sigma B factor antagonist
LTNQPWDFQRGDATSVPTGSEQDFFEVLSPTPSAGAGPVLLSLVGELDMTATATLADALDDALAQRRDVVLDCSQLTFVDAAGLGAVLVGHRDARRVGRSVRLVRVPEHIRKTFHLARLEGLLESSPA